MPCRIRLLPRPTATESPPAFEADPDFFDIGGQQGQGRQRRRADGKTFAGGGRGVAQTVQGVGPFADHRLQAGHFGVAAGVVGDRAISVGGQRDTQRAEHADRGDANAVQAEGKVVDVGEIPAAGETEGQQRRDADDDHRHPDAHHAVGDAADDHVAGPVIA